jgi:anaerobic selenocysteine-containing dehydrogenase
MVKKSFCHLCLSECGLDITTDNQEQIIKISSNFDDPVSRGYLCEKAQKLKGYQNSDDRIKTPLKKINGEYVSISWEQALDEIAEQLKKYLGQTLYMAPLSPTYNANTIYSFELMARLGVEYATNVFSYEKAYTLLTYQSFYKHAVATNKEQADVLIVIGQNPWVTQPYPRARTTLNDFKNNPNKTLVVIDPVESETAKIADLHLKLKPGTDVWLLSALIKLLIEQSAVDDEFIQSNTTNYPRLKEHFDKVNLADCLYQCGIGEEQILLLVTALKSKKVSIDFGNGICHSLFPYATNYLIVLLNVLMGNNQKSYYSLLDNLHHYLKNTKTPNGKRQQSGIISSAILADNLKFKCVIIDNVNPVTRTPNRQRLIEEFKNVDLVIALDSFTTASTNIADYILPTPTFFERYECVNAVHSDNQTVQLSRPIFKTTAKTANEIYELLVDKINPIELADFATLTEKFNNREPEVYYTLAKTIGAKYQTPILAVLWWDLYKFNNHNIEITNQMVDQINQTGVLKINNNIHNNDIIDLTPSYLLSTLKLSKLNSTDSFVLQCGYRQKDSMNGVIANQNEPVLEIFEDDAERMGITDNEQIILETALTQLKINCKLVNNTQCGLLRIPNHSIINQLSNDNNVDYLSPQYKYVSANIRKINGNL